MAVTRSPAQPAQPTGCRTRVDPSAIRPKKRPLRSLKRSGSPNVIAGGRRGEGHDLRKSQPDGEDRDGESESRQGPVRPDVEDLALEADGRLDADKGAESPQERRAGDEIREGGPNAVAAAGQVMAELVAGENDHQGQGVEEAEADDAGIEKRRDGSALRCQEGTREEVHPREPGREDGQAKEQPVQPDLLFGVDIAHDGPKKRSEAGSLLFQDEPGRRGAISR